MISFWILSWGAPVLLGTQGAEVENTGLVKYLIGLRGKKPRKFYLENRERTARVVEVLNLGDNLMLALGDDSGEFLVAWSEIRIICL